MPLRLLRAPVDFSPLCLVALVLHLNLRLLVARVLADRERLSLRHLGHGEQARCQEVSDVGGVVQVGKLHGERRFVRFLDKPS